jgi:hypothetical protein
LVGYNTASHENIIISRGISANLEGNSFQLAAME